MNKAGFYIHVPFCRQACRYCDFHFAVSLAYTSEMIQAMRREIEIRKEDYRDFEFSTLYFGGGTPSVLNINELAGLIEQVKDHYSLRKNAEITLEANPDDLTNEYLHELKNLGINRLSIGVQSFRDEDLTLMRRSHNSKQSVEAVKRAQNTGINNINIDLIYGIPGLNVNAWKENLQKAFDLNIQHISAYHLTYEPGTVFDHWRKKKKLIPLDEEISLKQFSILKELTRQNDFIHYEISNFAREDFFSMHNSFYWNQVPYIGIGPSAHSFVKNERRWNISKNKEYMKSLLQTGDKYYEKEELNTNDQYNEFVLTSLRTYKGIDQLQLEERFGNNYVKYTNKIAKAFLKNGEMEKKENRIFLTDKGILISDYIMSEFFRIE